jgi:hypothetical protein
MHSAHSRSGPVHEAGRPWQDTIGHAHQVSNAWSQISNSSSSLPQPEMASTRRQPIAISNEKDLFIEGRGYEFGDQTVKLT